ncbi:MAG: hypothetical protein JJE47_11235 [Acidimicrobiia bacterium]|nr:hypothetical protein [Acidimicrobiia bacterium]
MSADDNIEIEFPSLTRTVQSSTPRPGSAAAADAADGLAHDDSTADDFAWLTAIFADDDETTVEELTTVEDIDDDSDPTGAGEPLVDQVEESVTGRTELLEDPPAPDDTLLPTDQIEDSLEHLDKVERPGIASSTLQRDAAIDTDRDHALETEAAQQSSTDDSAGQMQHSTSTTITTRSDLVPTGLAELKKANGFREEILSTFSQMYRKSARPD